MKRFKKIIFNILALVMLCGICFSTTACGADIKTLEVTVSVYSEEDGKMVDKVLTVDLYRHLAPETVDHIIDECVDKNYYDNAIFYKGSSETNGIMMGDLTFAKNGEDYTFNQITPLAPALDGVYETEFKAGGTKGSDLKVKEGSVALYRTWAKGSSYSTNAYFGTGRATWLMPTQEISKYNDYLCVFAQIDLDDEDNSETWSAIKSLFSAEDNYDEYVTYYTGTYDANKGAEENFGLTFNCDTKDDYDAMKDDIENLFVADDGQLVCYNETTIQVPMVEISNVSTLAAYIKSVKLA